MTLGASGTSQAESGHVRQHKGCPHCQKDHSSCASKPTGYCSFPSFIPPQSQGLSKPAALMEEADGVQGEESFSSAT